MEIVSVEIVEIESDLERKFKLNEFDLDRNSWGVSVTYMRKFWLHFSFAEYITNVIQISFQLTFQLYEFLI